MTDSASVVPRSIETQLEGAVENLVLLEMRMNPAINRTTAVVRVTARLRSLHSLLTSP